MHTQYLNWYYGMFNKPVYTDNNHFLGIGGYLDKDRALTGLITCTCSS